MSEVSKKIDHTLMWPGVIVTGIIGLLLSLFPESGRAVVDTLFAILTHNFKWLFLMFGLFCVIFLATTLNSAAYTLSSQVTINLSGDEEPPRWNRTLWGIILGLLALGLLSTGALKAVQLSSIVVALPLIPVLLLMVFSLMKWLKEDYGEILKTNVQALPPEKIKPAV